MENSEDTQAETVGVARRLSREQVLLQRQQAAARAAILDADVADIARPWGDSSYFTDAEAQTHAFWRPTSPFRKMFDRLDLASVVELACGHGRHGEQMAAKAGKLVMIDVLREKLDLCRERLKAFTNIEFLTGNGKDFEPLPDESVTAVFCYDAMVHFSPAMIEAYLADTARILKPGGMALFHHSNYGDAPGHYWGENPHLRNHMTVPLFLQMVEKARLKLVELRVIEWGHVPDLDAITLVRKP